MRSTMEVAKAEAERVEAGLATLKQEKFFLEVEKRRATDRTLQRVQNNVLKCVLRPRARLGVTLTAFSCSSNLLPVPLRSLDLSTTHKSGRRHFFRRHFFCRRFCGDVTFAFRNAIKGHCPEPSTSGRSISHL